MIEHAAPEAADMAGTFTPDWVSPPGDTIADLLEEKGWSQRELAQRTGYTTKHISLLINGKAPINQDTALKLEFVLGSNARFWLNREAQYREAIARAEELHALEADKDWLKQLPMKEMISFKWINAFKHKGQQVAECLRYFGVASVQAWENQYGALPVAYRASPAFEKAIGPVAAWLRQGEKVASELDCQPYDGKHFRVLLEAFRALTQEADPAVFLPRLIARCAEAGVAVVVCPAPKGCPASGATRWLSNDKALLMLSLRYKSNDHFWFTFFHEAAHLLLHQKRMMFLEVTKDGLDGKLEAEADAFARDWLIPPEAAQQLPMLDHSEPAIRAYAQQLGIAPGIVVGRMQKEALLPWQSYLNELKVRYKWDHDE